MSCKVSIITICYNSEKEIGETLKSIIDQTFDDYEIVIKDGLSEDNTIKIVNDFISSYPQCQITVESSKDGGIYNAMNIALEKAKGEWVFFLNSGDSFASKEVLKTVSQSLTDDNDIIYGNVIMRDSYGKSRWKGDIKNIKNKMPFGHQSCFVRKDLAQKFKFNECFRIAADYDMVLRLYLAEYRFKYVDADIAIFDMDGVSSTRFYVTMCERYKVRSANGVISANYTKSVSYKKDILISKLKEFISNKLSNRLLIWLREIYKWKIKKYQKI